MGQDLVFKKPRNRASRFALCGFFILVLATFSIGFGSRPAFATCNPCTQCPATECPIVQMYIQMQHALYEARIKIYITQAFYKHKNWLGNTFMPNHIIPQLMRMTEQLSAVGVYQMLGIGMFFDAKQQLETQRLLQELQAQAHKDYQPSEDFCWFGTAARSLASSERKAVFNTQALNARQMARHLGNANVAGAMSADQDKKTRWRQFAEVYCDPQDNNWTDDTADSGLVLACTPRAGVDRRRVNKDVDYTRLIEEPRSLNVSYSDAAATPDEEDVFAMGNNLYGHDTLRHDVNPEYLKNEQYQHLYLALRTVAAKRSVAENSFNSIVGLKSSGTSGPPAGGGAPDPHTREFLAAVLAELGVNDENSSGSNADEIEALLGQSPSYYAQLEVLAKKIYQNPDFYANLYDTPANIQRKSVALKAISLMLDRAIYESQVRQEMAMSVLLSSRMRNTFRDVNKDLSSVGGE